MEYNFSDYNSKNALDKNKKIEAAAARYLSEAKEQERAAAEKLQEDEYMSLMNGAKFSNTSSYIKNRERAKRLQESLFYRDKTTKMAMTEYIFNIVENALLIDKDEYEALNPNYKTETKEMISSFLENAEINKNIHNEDTLTLMEHISKNMPTVATGVLLEQSEIWNLINEAADKKIEKAIDKLSDDVQENVAKIVSDEQKKKKSLQNELEKKEEEKEEVIEDKDDEPKDEDIEDEIED